MKEDWNGLIEKLGNEIPLSLPEGTILDGEDYSGWLFELRTYAGSNEKYLKAMYVNPLDTYRYVFNSSYLEELIEYLDDLKDMK